MKNQENSFEVVICDLSGDDKKEIVVSVMPEPQAVKFALELFPYTMHNIFVRSDDVDIVRLIHSVE